MPIGHYPSYTCARGAPLHKEEFMTLHYFLTWVQTLGREEGQDLAEYALLIALIAVAVVLIIGALGFGIGNILKTITGYLNPATPYQP